MVGVLTIPEIDLQLPVVAGAGKKELAYALGAILGLNEPGKQDGSFAIAGHRSAVFGKFFNRLEELKSGSLVKLETEDRQMMFKVFDKKIVAPEEVNVLQAQRGKSLLSLVTCHPQHSSKYRLVIQAKRIQ